jgi:hypothetical protein
MKYIEEKREVWEDCKEERIEMLGYDEDQF